jgi:hypothetical protein
MPDATRSQPPKRLDDMRQVLRLHHDSMHTERASVEWLVRVVTADDDRRLSRRRPVCGRVYVAGHLSRSKLNFTSSAMKGALL